MQKLRQAPPSPLDDFTTWTQTYEARHRQARFLCRRLFELLNLVSPLAGPNLLQIPSLLRDDLRQLASMTWAFCTSLSGMDSYAQAYYLALLTGSAVQSLIAKLDDSAQVPTNTTIRVRHLEDLLETPLTEIHAAGISSLGLVDQVLGNWQRQLDWQQYWQLDRRQLEHEVDIFFTELHRIGWRLVQHPARSRQDLFDIFAQVTILVNKLHLLDVKYLLTVDLPSSEFWNLESPTEKIQSSEGVIPGLMIKTVGGSWTTIFGGFALRRSSYQEETALSEAF